MNVDDRPRPAWARSQVTIDGQRYWSQRTSGDLLLMRLRARWLMRLCAVGRALR